MIITVTANTLLDLMATGSPVPGSITRVKAFTPIAGGKGINVARVLARHGQRVMACGFAGGATGAMLTELVAADGVEPAFTPIAACSRLGFQLVDPGHTSAVMEEGFSVTASECGALLSQVRRLLGAAAMVIIGGSIPDPQALALFRQICDACAHAGVTCWVDAYGPAMESCVLGLNPPDLAKPNREEYAALSTKAWLACRELHVSDGPRQLRVLHPDGRFTVTPPVVDEINATGSGDCYLAALAHGRLSKWPLEEQLRYAAAAGAANAARPDVAAIGPEDIRPWLSQVTVTAEA